VTEQLVLDIPGWPPLTVEPTPAMVRGSQRIFQCSWCGCVVVVPSPARLPLGACPAQHSEPTSWWEQALPVAGLQPDHTDPRQCTTDLEETR
jgi:hypothetical protein